MIGGPEDPIGSPNPGGGKSDTLDYIADIIHELKQLAERAGYKTLAAILGAALIEARIQSEEQNRRS